MVMLLTVVAASGCGGVAIPFISTPTPVPGPVPEGWTLHQAAKAQIAAPSPWIAVEMTAENVDRMVAKMQDTNPQLVDIVERAKTQEGLLFMAVDPASSRGFAANLNVVLGNKLIASMGQYWQFSRKRLEESGMETEEGELRSVGGRDVLFAALTQTMRLPSSQMVRIRADQAMVDLGAERYIITLTYRDEESAHYGPLLEQMMQTIRYTS